MRRLALLLCVVWATPAFAKPDKDDEEDSDKPKKKKDKDKEKKDQEEEKAQGDDEEDTEKPKKKAKKEDREEKDEGDEEGSDDEEGSAPKEKGKAATAPETTTDQALPPKQDLNGHDLGTKKRDNEFEHDRFFVDKIDTEKTEDKTLIQGSLASSTFFYAESGGAYPTTMTGNNTGPSRVFTELRLQTDFRHISASRWDARIDVRGRLVNTPQNDGAMGQTIPTDANHVQSGLTGTNELEARELWIIRNGERSDVFFGRQFIPDMGGVKIDGLRLDYAASAKITAIVFGGLYPLRGSRSITTDYPELKSQDGTAAGRFVGIGGGGVAYRTINSYGAVGGVAEVPLQQEQARVYATSNGYYRAGPKFDFYHLLLLDVIGTAASQASAHVQFTNASAGINVKPDQRLRITASFHHVDTETLNVQAGAFLGSIDRTGGGNLVVQNEAYILRLATNMARAGISAGLGRQQRFEISTAVTYRNRPAFILVTPDNTVADIKVDAANSLEIWGSVVDRQFFGETRVGIDASKSFGIGSLAYQRSVADMYRLFVNRLIQDGRGDWEGELSYTNVKDNVVMGGACANMSALVVDCYGNSNNSIISVTGQLFYRIKEDWFGIGNLSIMRTTNTRDDGVVDPPVLGFTGFLRIAKRF